LVYALPSCLGGIFLGQGFIRKIHPNKADQK